MKCGWREMVQGGTSDEDFRGEKLSCCAVSITPKSRQAAAVAAAAAAAASTCSRRDGGRRSMMMTRWPVTHYENVTQQTKNLVVN